MAASIPKLVELLESSDQTVQNATSRTLRKLAGHGLFLAGWLAWHR